MNYLWVIGFLCGLTTQSVADVEKPDAVKKLTCLDHKGGLVVHGDRYFPLGSDPCTQCTCINGKPEMCISVFCSPPENCRQYHALSDKCCEFVCLDRDFPNKPLGNGSYPGKDDPDSLSTTNLGLRLVASTVTSFLILALLLFMIHRLRQRRLLLMIRRFHARRMDAGNSHLSRRYSEDDDGSVGYFVGHDHLDFSRYDELPPPYTLWKPPEMYIPPGEAPPPYDLSVQLTAPYTGGARSNFNSGYQLEIEQQHAPPVVENHMLVCDSLPEVATVNVPVNQNQEIQQQYDRVPSVSSMSVLSDTEVDNPVNSSDRVALPPDIQYEESLTYRTNNVAVLCVQQESDAPVSDLNEEDLVNGNVIPNIINSESFNDNIEVSGSSCSCAPTGCKGKSSASWSKRHSCSEFTDQNKGKLHGGKHREKRFSLGVTSTRHNNNLYPDPTVWSGEASESSSSSSPTYDQPTLSPSTSDSSSVDADFSHDSPHELKNTTPAKASSGKVTIGSNDGIQCSTSKTKDLGDDIAKPHFHKTLSHLKKFSLIKRKKKKRREEKPGEISCSFVCQNISDNALPNQPAFSPSPDSVARSCENSIPRPMEAINPHIGHKLASSGVKVNMRPTNINIPGQSFRSVIDKNTSYCASSHVEPGQCPLSPTVVAIHCSTAAKMSHLQTNLHAHGASLSPDSSCEGVQNYITQQHSMLTTHSPPSLRRHGITRSGSICSETGERRHHKSVTSSPLNTSQPKHLEETFGQHAECKKSDVSSDTHCLSSINVPTGCRTSVDVTPEASSDSHSSQAEDSIVRNIPIWIVNSMAVLPRQEYEPHGSQGISVNMSRCLSVGQIGEGSLNPVSGGNVPVTLEIRDPTICDSSWEACSHL